MGKYAAFDETGKITGFYSDDIHQPEHIPEQSIPIVDDQWMECINNQGKYMVDTQEKVLKIAPPPPGPTLEEIQALKNAQIKQQLSALDTYMPRGLEDYFITSGFDITKLPQIQQDRLKQKQNLRAQLK